MEEKDSTEQIYDIIRAAVDIGWSVAVSGKDDEVVTGLIIGTEDYIENILKYLPDAS